MPCCKKHNTCHDSSDDCKYKCDNQCTYNKPCKIKCKRGKRGHEGLRGPTGPTGIAGTAVNTGATGPTGPAVGTLIPFSSGYIISPLAISLTSDLVMGFGSSFSPASTLVATQMGGYSFPIPFDGTITSMEISADLIILLAPQPQTITYTFTVYVSSSTNNVGTSFVTNAYALTGLTGTLVFTMGAAGSYSASNLIIGALAVSAGDRVGVIVEANNTLLPNIFGSLAVMASLTYEQ
ncbi:MAG TPA: hypothetical protein VLG50_07435 [Candidatus Saccharimonadales bacterium]|nr:hypothetical protein [Candidatus Saccharimonadales bacterium]